MCKILIIPNTKKVTDLKRLIDVSHQHLKSQRDGFGYVAQGEDLKLFGERSADVEAFTSTLSDTPPLLMPFVEQTQNQFGPVKNSARAFMAHGRISTNNPGLGNAHPIVSPDLSSAVIHNGVVTNHGPDYVMTTSNDSEHILRYCESITELSENLTGYYAFGAFQKNGDLVVARDRIANLYAIFCYEIESMVYATTKELLDDVCRSMGWYKKSAKAKLLDDVFIRHAVDGKCSWVRFKSLGKDAHSAKHALASLGRALDSDQHSLSYLGQAMATRSESTGSGLTKKDRKAATLDLINECTHEFERASLRQFFKFIQDPRSVYSAWSGSSQFINKAAFRGMHPWQQIKCEVIDADQELVDPYYSRLDDAETKALRFDYLRESLQQEKDKAATAREETAKQNAHASKSTPANVLAYNASLGIQTPAQDAIEEWQKQTAIELARTKRAQP